MHRTMLALPDTTKPEIERAAEAWLVLDLKPRQKGGRGRIEKDASGVGLVEDKDPHALENLVHLALIFFTLGLWLLVWLLIANNRRTTKRRVHIAVGETDGGTPVATITGSDEWVQSTTAHLTRMFPNALYTEEGANA